MIKGHQEVLEMMVNGRPLSDILHKLIRIVETIFADKICSIHLVDETGEMLQLAAAPSLPGEYSRSIDVVKIGPGRGACGSAAWHKKTVIVSNLWSDPACRPWRDIARRLDIRSCWSLPVLSASNKVLGTFAVYSRHVCTPNKENVKVVEMLSFLLGEIIEKYHAGLKMERLAYLDPLTSLPNRRYFIERLEQALTAAESERSKVGVLFLGLDWFKPINDTFGHEMGDRVLQVVSRKIREALPQTKVLARMDGDEFAVLSRIDRIEEAELLCKQLLRIMEEPLYYAGHLFHISASIGISLFPDHGGRAEDLIQHADIAMCQVKSRGKKDYGLYEPKMSEKIYKNFMMVSDFNRALRENEFVLHYQPRYHTGTSKIQCVEALIRWDHPESGTISPLEFIPLAEETGFIIPLGKWVLREACRQNKAWQDQGLPPVRVAVNCSSRQLQQDDFIPMIKEVIAQTRLSPEWLEIEITESGLMRSEHTNIVKLRELRSLGIHISIDDFGTGYSSLNYLMQFDVHALKIDRRFVQQIPNAVIANTIISLCRSLGLNVIAEGVETVEQYEYLRRYGCDEVQGFLFGKPLPAKTFEMLLRKNEILVRNTSINAVQS
ncbi:EAL domain-containing protein [Paenibacillus allorhizosphaerae]|uniref:EAL domain-containing protein n=1 Tax=Paenibacillus allorhizosphaerae TaxID=2849866 RepID=A0ABM8VJA0_9BACL|nr:EAL domain-containing protein [Paenibacillus allorhizosphaerae]CAG7645191.1 hypothetical protein PAECIP111802_03452 [Paenibacillus allorhizosphaerae]